MPLGFLKRVLASLGIYATAKRWYQRIWNRSEYERFKRDLESLSPMIPSGSLVIDVGANQGSLVERYLALGARVVAVEPNPGLADLLRQRHPSVEVVQAAVGAEPGRATLPICSQDTHSTPFRQARRSLRRWP